MKCPLAVRTAIALTVLCHGTVTYAQETTVVRGVVKDAGTGELISGASVAVKNAPLISTASRDNGEFSLRVANAANATLVVRRIGYRALNISIGSHASDIIAALERDPLKLDDVVVTGYVSGVTKSNAANAVTVLRSEDVTRVPSASIENAFQGKIAGAQIYKNTGAPGGGNRVMIRGSGSINGSISPLYVIDGVIVSDAPVAPGLDRVTRAGGGGFAAPSQEDPVNRITDLNPDEIEKIEVLKGSSAAAIYGSKASGGVILITTKRGVPGKRRFTYNSSFGTARLDRKLGARRFSSLAQAKAVYDPTNSFGDSVWATLFSPDRYFDHEQLLYGEKPLSYEQSVSLSGGSDGTRYYFSGLARHDGGIVRNTFADKKTFRANVDQTFSSRILLSLGSEVIRTTGDRGLFGNENAPGGGSVAFAIARMPTFFDFRRAANGSFPENRFWTSNPYQTIDLFKNGESVWRTINSGRLEYQFLRNERHELRVVANGGLDLIHQRNNVYSPPELEFEKQDQLPGTAEVSEFRNLDQTLNFSALHVFAASSRLTITSQIGTQLETEDRQLERVRGENLVGGVALPSAGTVRDFSISNSAFRDFGIFGQSEALVGDRLLLTVGARADRSSNNGDAGKFYFFPKASASYVMRTWSIPALDELKFRAAYGQTGNRPFYGDRFTSLGSGVIGGLTGITIGGSRGSPEIRPERQREFEGGIDAALFHRHASLELTGYQRNISDLLLDRTVPRSLGYSSERVNGGALRIRGLEVAADAIQVPLNWITWSSRLSFSSNTSKVLRLLEPLTPFGSRLIDGQILVQPGHSLTEMIAADTMSEAGVCPPKVVDPTLCVGAAVGSVHKVYFGDANPKYNAGWSNELRWKAFSLFGVFDRQKGGLLRSTTWANYDNVGNSPDCDAPSPNPAQNLCQYRAAVGAKTSRIYLQDASYFKLRELTFSVDVPKHISRALLPTASEIRISLSGRNLKAWTKYRGGDPEYSNFGGTDALVQLQRNRELAPYPSHRDYWLTVQAAF